jgi:hypothetical protein
VGKLGRTQTLDVSSMVSIFLLLNDSLECFNVSLFLSSFSFSFLSFSERKRMSFAPQQSSSPAQVLRLLQHRNVCIRLGHEARQVKAARGKDAVLLHVEPGGVEEDPEADVQIEPLEQPLPDVGLLEGGGGEHQVLGVDDCLVGRFQPGDLSEGKSVSRIEINYKMKIEF